MTANGGTKDNGGNGGSGVAGGTKATGGTAAGGSATGGIAAAGGSPAGGADGGPPPVFTGPTVTGTVTVTRSTTMGRVVPGLASFSFEKTHVSDAFFTATHANLIGLFKLLGTGVFRIGANDVDNTTWTPSAPMLGSGKTSYQVGTAGVDALAAFLNATGWKVIYGVNLKNSTAAAAAAEATYVAGKLGSSLDSFEIGNEISFYGSIATIQPRWDSSAVAIQAGVPNAAFAGPAVYGDMNFTSTFTADEASKLTQVTYHYYRGAASSNPPLSQLLTIDSSVASASQQLATIATSNKIRDGFRWGEMNSYSGHGAAGVSDVFGAALWSIDFMLTTAQYGAIGCNFHGGGQNQDGNICSNGVASCTKPFRYSPLIEVDSQVTAAAPLYYGMLLVSQAGVGNMLSTKATVGSLNFSAYTITPADGSTNVVLVNKDATNGANVSINVGAAVTRATAVYLQAPSLTSTTGVTFAGSGVSPSGVWSPNAPYTLPTSGNTVTIVVPPAMAVVVHAT
jgi:hypothetical protein